MEEAFVEGSEIPKRTVKNIRLPINEAGQIDWDSASDKHKQAFIDAIKADPNGILQNIQEEAGQQPSAESADPTGVADATVLAGANAIMIAEAFLIAPAEPQALFHRVRCLRHQQPLAYGQMM